LLRENKKASKLKKNLMLEKYTRANQCPPSFIFAVVAWTTKISRIYHICHSKISKFNYCKMDN